MFSKKATKFGKIFVVDLKLCSKFQIDGEDFVNFCGLLGKYELYCPNIYTLCLFSQHEFLQNSNWQNGSPLNFLCRRRNLTSFFLWIDFRFRRLHRFWHRLCCQMCSAHWSQPWCQSWTALGWDGCQGILEHRIWEKGKRDFCLNCFLCNHQTSNHVT